MKLFQTGSSTDKELAKKLFPRMRSYVPIVVLKGKDAAPERVLVWSFGSMIYQKLLGYFMNEKVGDYFDADNGFNLTVNVVQNKGKQFPDVNVELDALSGRCPLNDDPEKIKSILASIPDITKMWPLNDAETIQKNLDEWLAGSFDDGSKDAEGTDKTKKAKDVIAPLTEEAKPRKAKAVTAAKPKVEEPSEPATKSSLDELEDAFSELMDE